LKIDLIDHVASHFGEGENSSSIAFGTRHRCSAAADLRRPSLKGNIAPAVGPLTLAQAAPSSALRVPMPDIRSGTLAASAIMPSAPAFAGQPNWRLDQEGKQ
jgi:hypothetical protein